MEREKDKDIIDKEEKATKTERKLSKIEKLFLNYNGKYEKVEIDWGEVVGKEIW